MARYTFQDERTISNPFIKYLIYDPYPEGDPPPGPKFMDSIILPMPGGLEFSNQASYEESGDEVVKFLSQFGNTIDLLQQNIQNMLVVHLVVKQ